MIELCDEQLELVAGGNNVDESNTVSVFVDGTVSRAFVESNGHVSVIKSGGKHKGFWKATATNVKSLVTTSQSISINLTNNN